MSERPDPHAADTTVGEHGKPNDHDLAPDHDGHGGEHGGEALGPVDLQAWGAAALGALLGLVVIAALIMATA